METVHRESRYVLVRLNDMEVETPWLVFPLQALVATTQIEVFYDQFT